MKMRPLAVAIAAVLPAAGALAGTVTGTLVPVSSEYLAIVGEVQAANDLTVNLDQQYAIGDEITFTFSAPPKASSSTAAFTFPATIAIVDETNTAATTSAGAVSRLAVTDTSVTYRVTDIPENIGGTITIATQPYFRATDMGTGDVTLSTLSKVGGGGTTTFDASTAVKIVDQTGTQFAYTVTGLTQTIDVESDRLAFDNGTNATTANHDIVVTQVTAATSAGNTTAPTVTVTPGTIAVTLTGDFAWLDSDATTTGIQTTNISFGLGGSSVTSATRDTIVVNLPAGGDTITIGNASSVNGAIPAQSLNSAISAAYATGGTAGTSTASVTGAYTLNGSSVTVFAVPTSTAVNNFIWLTNTGSDDGAVSIVIHDNGTDIDLGVVGISEGGAEFDVTSAMNAALEAAGRTLSGGRVHIDIITQVPAADVAISAAYRVGDDRVNLLSTLDTDLVD